MANSENTLRSAGGESRGRGEPLDSVIHITTPENIAITYRLAGPFRRLPAFIVDVLVRFVIVIAVMFLATVSAIAIGEAVMLPFVLLFMFALEWFYGGVFETFWNGQTPGKRLMQIRVLTADGRPIDGLQATMRNILRFADMFFITGLVACAMSRRYQRLGDLVCGTMVVIEERRWLTGVAKVEPLAGQLAAYIPADFRVSRTLARAVAHYVDRRRFFSPARRREIAQHLAAPLIERFQLPRDTSYDLMLCALYYRAFIADRSDEPPPPLPQPPAPPPPLFAPSDVYAAPASSGYSIVTRK